MNLELPFRTEPHFRNDLSPVHRIALANHHFVVLPVGAQVGVVMLDDDQVAVRGQSVPCIDHLRHRGVELGAGIRYTDAVFGLTLEANARGLVAHQDSAYEEWGAWATLRLDPGEPGKGLSLSLSPTWGAANSGLDQLWNSASVPGYGVSTPGYGVAAPAYGTGVPGYGKSTAGSAADTAGYTAASPGCASETQGYAPVSPGYAANAWLNPGARGLRGLGGLAGPGARLTIATGCQPSPRLQMFPRKQSKRQRFSAGTPT